jgi:hypothetical protein
MQTSQNLSMCTAVNEELLFVEKPSVRGFLNVEGSTGYKEYNEKFKILFEDDSLHRMKSRI